MTAAKASPFLSSAASLETVFRGNAFYPASVQRGFEWGGREAEALLDGLDGVFSALESDDADADDAAEEGETAADDDAVGAAIDEIDALDELALESRPDAPTPPLDCFFLGSIVLVRDADGDAAIYDGVQRITTLTTLFCVLRDLAADQATRARLEELIRAGARNRLRLRSRDEILETSVLAPGAALRIPKTPPRRPLALQLHRVKSVLAAKLEPWSEERRARFVDFLLGRVWVNLVEPADPRLGRQIFVSTNLHGKPLNPISILKGQISDLAPDDKSAAEIGAIWDQVSTDLGAAGFERLLAAIDVIERAAVQGEQWPTDLGEHLASALPPEKALRWMRRLQSYAVVWKRLMTLLVAGGESPIERSIWRLRAFPWPEWRPLALYYMRELELATRHDRLRGDTRRFFTEAFDLLHRRCMALTLLSSPGARQTVFAKALAQARRRQNPFRYANRRRGDASDGALIIRPKQREKIDRMLSGQIRDRDIWAPLSAWIEMTTWRDDAPALMRSVSTEHVLPRNPAEGSADFARLGGSEAYDRRCYALGNMVVVPESLNAKLDNKPYDKKRELLRREAAGYGAVADVVAHDAWGAAEIDARTARLTALVWSELGYQRPAAARAAATPAPAPPPEEISPA